MRVVGIGASAGGLAALQQMLKHLPPKTGLAFILVQHLSADHPSVLVDLLRPLAKTRVSEARDGTRPEPDHFYVCPAGVNIALENGVIRLAALNDAQKGHMSIDQFFYSLALDQREGAVGVILSGTGSDGAAGLRALKHAGGLTFAEDPTTAEHAAMPESAIETGCVDFVLTVPEIAAALARIVALPPDEDLADQPSDAAEASGEDARTILELLKKTASIDFGQYKPATITRRMGRRMVVQGLETFKDYAEYLRSHPPELEMLANDLLIGVTEFFRDPDAFQALAASVYPKFQAEDGNGRVRIWVPGCSSGQEPYSIAISLLEAYEDEVPDDIQIFATDLSAKSIVKARLGIYSPDELHRGLSEERIERFFTRVEKGYQIQKRIREMCVFARQNVIKDPPFSRLDLICCRNLLIYLKPSVQKQLVSIFHFALKPDRYLLLGKSESIPGGPGFFTPLDKANKIYLKTNNNSAYQRDDTPAVGLPSERPPRQVSPQFDDNKADLQAESDQILLARYAPAGVVVDNKLDIVLYRGYTGRYLEASPGKPDLNLLRMIQPGMLTELEPAFERAKREHLPVRIESIRVDRDGDSWEINLEIIPLGSPGEPAEHFLILFEENAASRGKRRRPRRVPASKAGDEKEVEIARLARELAHTRLYIKSIIQKHAAHDEELTTLNEEVLSSNEEFQSMNEELEAAKEELQASQEELITLNEELRIRNGDLSRLNDELTNVARRAEDAGAYARAVVETVKEPLLLLNNELRVQEANSAYYDTFGSQPGLTLEKRIDQLDGEWWRVPELQSMLKQALAGEEASPALELELPSGDGGSKSMLFSARPINVNRRPGPLILLAVLDITSQRRALEASGLRSLSAHLQKQIETERTRIARQVHDEIGQALTALQLELGSLKTTPECAASKADQMIAMVQQTLEIARQISRDLRPPLLEELGLKEAIEWQLEAFEAAGEIKTNLDYRVGTLPSNADLLTNVMRILQEALTNVTRHAQASVVTVTLTNTDDRLVMEIADDGVGIDKAKIMDSRSLGILGMRERCAAHHGKLRFVTKKVGTTVRAEFPVASPHS